MGGREHGAPAPARIVRAPAPVDVIPTSRGAEGRSRQSQRRKSHTSRVRVAPLTSAPPPVAYERTPGAAAVPLPAGTLSGGRYRRHEPEKTALYGIVRDHLETFLSRAGETGGDGYPRFVEHEFRRYLDCGLLCHGFARLRCAECGYERLVAFSCKGKLCPSCLARRAGDTAAWLVDHLLPEAGYRQWVLTFPFTMRFRLAADRRLLTALLGIFLRTLFAWQRRRGRELGIVGGQTGAVTFLQRFGSALNLNPHLHAVIPDGLFVHERVDAASAVLAEGRGVAEAGVDGEGATGVGLRFVALPPPTTADVEMLTLTVAQRLTDRLAADAEERSDYLDPDLAALCEALFWSQNPPPGTRDLPRLPGMEGEGGGEREAGGLGGKPLCASVAGFSLHAAQSVAPHDREALERLLRYGLRAPFSSERLSRRPDGKVVYKLRRPWPHAGGHTHLVLDPLDFLRRLAALISYPRSHSVRRHGVFANRSRWRSLLPPPPPSRFMETEQMEQTEEPQCGIGVAPSAGVESEASAAGGVVSAADATGCSATDPAMERREPDAATPRRRVSWANLLCRVLSVDALACPRCSTRERRVPMTVLAFLTDPDVVGKILRHLGLPTSAPALASVGRSPQPELGFALAGEDAEPRRRDAEGDGEEGSGPRAPPSGLFR